jgi:hypothetical protein
MTSHLDHLVPDPAGGGPSAVPLRHRIPLEQTECLRLLASVPVGRIVFAHHALPQIRPVNHLLLQDRIMFRTHDHAALLAVTGLGQDDGAIVAYEADHIDPDTHTGWSVIVTGRAHRLTDPDDMSVVQRLLSPWVDGEPRENVVMIQPELITGFRLV